MCKKIAECLGNFLLKYSLFENVEFLQTFKIAILFISQLPITYFATFFTFLKQFFFAHLLTLGLFGLNYFMLRNTENQFCNPIYQTTVFTTARFSTQNVWRSMDAHSEQ
jgi:hypothetical protein